MNFDTLLSTPDSTMETTIFKYESYELLKNKNGEYMIIGYDQVLLKNNPKIRDAGEKVLMNSPSLLYAFIELYSKLGIKGGNRNEIEKQVSKNIEKIKPIIIDFCKEHGLPYYGNIGEYDIHNNFTYNPEDIFENNAFDKLRKDNNALAISFCNLSFFLYWLHILYRDFLWHITMTDQTDIIENFENNLKINMSKFKNARPKKKYFFPGIVNRFSYNSRLQKTEIGYQFMIFTNNIFHLATYYFCLICVGGISLEKTLIIKPKCKLCGSPFITAHKQARYCRYCSPQKAWNAKHR